MDIEYRRAEASDLPLLASMHQQSVEDECSEPSPSLPDCEAAIECVLNRGGEAIVFRADGDDVGYALFLREPEGIWLRHFFVSRPHRRQGIGRAAMRWLVADAWKEPARVRLAVHVENPVGIAFWRGIGFSDWLYEMKLEATGPAE